MQNARTVDEICDSIRALAALEAERRSIGLVQSKSATAPQPFRASENRKLAERVLENLTNVAAQWLGNATPICEQLMAKAADEKVSDADFIKAVEDMALSMPDLFDQLDWKALAAEMEKVQGAAMVNGIAQRNREFMKGR